MAEKVGFLKLALPGLTGVPASAVVAILLRPGYLSIHHYYSPESVTGKPMLPMMITEGLPGTDPSSGLLRRSASHGVPS